MKHIFFLVSLLATLNTIQAQDTLFFKLSNPWNTIKSDAGSYTRKAVKEKDYYHVWDVNAIGTKITEGYYTDTNFAVKVFCHHYYNEQEGWLMI